MPPVVFILIHRSQMRRMLDILEAMLTRLGLTHRRMDGTTPIGSRQASDAAARDMWSIARAAEEHVHRLRQASRRRGLASQGMHNIVWFQIQGKYLMHYNHLLHAAVVYGPGNSGYGLILDRVNASLKE